MTYTRDHILSMTDEELRLAIMKAQGWTYQQDAPDGRNCFEYGDHSGWWLPPDGKTTHDWRCAKCQMDNVPDPTHDIAASFELEGEITDPLDRIAYMDFLATFGKGADTNFTRWNLIHASAEDRSALPDGQDQPGPAGEGQLSATGHHGPRRGRERFRPHHQEGKRRAGLVAEGCGGPGPLHSPDHRTRHHPGAPRRRRSAASGVLV